MVVVRQEVLILQVPEPGKEQEKKESFWQWLWKKFWELLGPVLKNNAGSIITMGKANQEYWNGFQNKGSWVKPLHDIKSGRLSV